MLIILVMLSLIFPSQLILPKNMKSTKSITVKGLPITIVKIFNDDYISLTDIARKKILKNLKM